MFTPEERMQMMELALKRANDELSHVKTQLIIREAQIEMLTHKLEEASRSTPEPEGTDD